MNYYEILHIKENATNLEIKEAYRKLAKTIHPDINKSTNAQHEFEQLRKAFETLYDPLSREDYDQQLYSQRYYERSFNFNYNFSNQNYQSNENRYKSEYKTRTKFINLLNKRIFITIFCVLVGSISLALMYYFRDSFSFYLGEDDYNTFLSAIINYGKWLIYPACVIGVGMFCVIPSLYDNESLLRIITGSILLGLIGLSVYFSFIKNVDWEVGDFLTGKGLVILSCFIHFICAIVQFSIAILLPVHLSRFQTQNIIFDILALLFPTFLLACGYHLSTFDSILYTSLGTGLKIICLIMTSIVGFFSIKEIITGESVLKSN